MNSRVLPFHTVHHPGQSNTYVKTKRNGALAYISFFPLYRRSNLESIFLPKGTRGKVKNMCMLEVSPLNKALGVIRLKPAILQSTSRKAKYPENVLVRDVVILLNLYCFLPIFLSNSKLLVFLLQYKQKHVFFKQPHFFQNSSDLSMNSEFRQSFYFSSIWMMKDEVRKFLPRSC